jgi:hypothetical protein
VSVVESLRALPGEGDPAAAADVRFTDGRVVILFCPICGGLACGALSADIRVTNSTVEWRDLQYQNDYAESLGVSEIPVFSVTVNRGQYESTVRESA